ncbi:MAG TPA: nucleotide exchange factor GrpE [Methyloceanibacter sp.]|nr:nucleotide exchange factor GrpE [Methyloceanibacter sp.]
MPDDTNDPREANEDQAQPADSAKAETQDASDDATLEVGADLETLLGENAEMRDKLLRTMADMENLRRRTEREKADTARYAISNFARDVLTIGDNLKRAIEHVPAEAADQDPALQSFLEGVELTERELLNMMERHGVTTIEPLGQRFDPNSQQAMYEVPNTDVPEGTVVEVMQAGYMIGDRCLRPALVAVSKGGAKPGPQAKPGNDFGTGGPANDDFPAGGD